MPSKDFRMNPAVISEIQAVIRKLRQGLDDLAEVCLKIERLDPTNTTFKEFDAAGKRFHGVLEPIVTSMVAVDQLATKLEAKYH